MVFINIIKAFIFSTILFIGTWFNLLFIATPAIPFIFINRRIYFRWCSFFAGYFFLMMTCFLEDFFGIKIIITGDDLTKNKNRSLIILNHRTRLDWLFILLSQCRFQTLEYLKIVLKASLKHIPGPGWGMQHAAYLFLERTFEKDEQRMKNIIGYYKTCQSPVSVLMFPEGTNLSDKTKKKSNDYAAKQTTYNKPYDYCLHPRIKGFIYLVNIMRHEGIIDSVDDVTIDYEGKFPNTELDLLKGHIPKVVHVHIKRYNTNDIPKEDEHIGQWLEKCWDEKENRLKEFNTKKQFDLPTKRIHHEKIETNIKFQRRLAFIIWMVFILFWSYCIITYMKIKIYILIVCLFHIIMEVFANGIIDFVCQLDANDRQKQSSIKQD